MSNSFLHPVSELRYGTYDPADVADALRITRDAARERLAELLRIPDADRTFANTVLAFKRASEEFSAVAGRVFHLAAVVPGWTDAQALVSTEVADFGNELAFSSELYAALRAVRDGPGFTQLSAEERKLLTEEVERYERNGVASPPEVQAELREIRTRLSELQTSFQQNVIEATKVAGITVSEQAGLVGLSAPFIERAQLAARERGEDGYYVAYSQPAYFEVMTLCASATTRRRMYETHVSMAGAQNAAVIPEMRALRRRQANLLGFADFSDLTLVERMARNGKRVAEFLADLAERYRPLANAEHEQLLAYARELEKDPALELGPEDVDTGLHFYYASRQYTDLVGLDPATLREYLPLPQVVDETFAILHQLYGVTFEPVEVPVWHVDVDVYALRDETGRHLATMYADWIARPDKRSGAWKGNAYIAHRGSADDGLPYIGNVVFNFAAAEADQPVLCTLRDAETVLHEIGHFMHSALSNTELREQAGTSVKWDFVEAPSQIMENWFWQPEVLDRMARHYQTGKPLPPETRTALLASRAYRAGAGSMRQLALATVDLQLHHEFADSDVYAFAREVKQDFLPVPVWADDQLVASFQHVFAGGYASGYYSYKWAEVIEAALFERFAREGILNRDVGRAYAREVLARGGSAEPEALVEAFLGGPATPDAMLRRDGLSHAELVSG